MISVLRRIAMRLSLTSLPKRICTPRSLTRSSQASWRRRGRLGPVTFAGRTEKYVVMTDDFIGREIFTKGKFDHPKLESALRVLGVESVGTLVNVGATIGDVCIPALSRGQALRVFAFEPDPINFALLQINVEWNDCGSRTHCIPVALSDDRGSVQLKRPGWGNRGGVSVAGKVSPDEDAFTRASGVPTFLLDDFELELGRSDLIFMDVEGHELSVLRGSRMTLSQAVPVVLEFSAEFLQADEVVELIDLLRPRQRFVDLRVGEGTRHLAELRDLRAELLGRPRKRQTDVLVW